jgi:ADP-heptose:LPS heptosyltransferase
MGLARRSRRYNVDLVLDFSPRLETQFVSHLILRARTLTPSRLPRGIEMMLNLGGIPQRACDTASAYANVLQQAGVEMNDTRFDVILSAEEDSRFEKLLARNGFQGGEPIVLLFATDPNGRDGWPVESFGEMGMRLANNFGARLVAADEPSDRTFTDAVASLLPRGAIKLVAPRAVELVAAIARASIIVTDEPAIAQVAAEQGTPVIEVANSVRSGHVSSKTHRIVRGSSRGRVSTDEVYEIACEIIQESRSPSLFQRP